MRDVIIRHVIFTTDQGKVSAEDKKAVADFLGSPEHEEKLSQIGVNRQSDVHEFLKSVTPELQVIVLFHEQCSSDLRHQDDLYILAQIQGEYGKKP